MLNSKIDLYTSCRYFFAKLIMPEDDHYEWLPVQNYWIKLLNFATRFNFSYLNTLYVCNVINNFVDKKTVPYLGVSVTGSWKVESTFRRKILLRKRIPKNCCNQIHLMAVLYLIPLINDDKSVFVLSAGTFRFTSVSLHFKMGLKFVKCPYRWT